MKNTDNKNIDYFEDILFHPSLDIKDKILVLGFRIKPEKDKEENLFLIMSDRVIQTTKETFFVVNGITYQIDIKNRRPPKLSKQWSMDELNKICDYYLSQEIKQIVNPLDVFNKLKRFLKDHLELDEPDYTLLTTWAIGTYYFPIFSSYPYLHIKAPKESGKTQCLNFLNQTCLNATKARASLPALRDTIDSLRGTYLMDQADNLHRNNMEDLLDILTDSYKRGGGDIRKMVADKGKNWNLEEFQAYGPKAFASIHQLPEDLRDRCLVIALTRSKKNYKTLDEEDSIWKEARGDIYKLLISSFTDVTLQYNLKRAEYRYNPNPKIVGRQLELWLPMEVVMSVIGVSDEEQSLARQRFESRYGFSESQANELEKGVIEILLEMLNKEMEVIISPKEIAEKLDDMLFENNESFLSLKQKSVQVGKAINKFNLSSQKLPRNNKGERYLFKREQVEKVSNGYLTTETEVEDTPIYTNAKEPLKLGDF